MSSELQKAPYLNFVAKSSAFIPTPPSTTPEKSLDVPFALEETQRYLNSLGELISVLRSRLEPLIREEPRAEDNQLGVSPQCQLSGSIWSIKSQIELQVGNLQNILYRLEI